MCILGPHFPVIINMHYEPAFVTCFGWIVNGFNGLYFIFQGYYPVLTKP